MTESPLLAKMKERLVRKLKNEGSWAPWPPTHEEALRQAEDTISRMTNPELINAVWDALNDTPIEGEY